MSAIVRFRAIAAAAAARPHHINQTCTRTVHAAVRPPIKRVEHAYTRMQSTHLYAAKPVITHPFGARFIHYGMCHLRDANSVSPSDPGADVDSAAIPADAKKLLADHTEVNPPAAAPVEEHAYPPMHLIDDAQAAEVMTNTGDSEAKEKAAAAAAEVDRATFAPIPTLEVDQELKDDPEGTEAASIPKMPSSESVIRGTLWFDNMSAKTGTQTGVSTALMSDRCG